MSPWMLAGYARAINETSLHVPRLSVRKYNKTLCNDERVAQGRMSGLRVRLPSILKPLP